MLMNKASEIAMLDLPDDISDKELMKYIKRINQAKCQQEIKEKQEEIQRIESAGEPMEAAKLAQQMLEQLKKIHQMR